MGGSSTTVNESTYTPTEYELELQKMQSEYANAVAPNALKLNQTAGNLLENSLGTVQVDFDSLNNKAQSQINAANAGLSQISGINNKQLGSTNNALSNVSNSWGSAANDMSGSLSSLQNGVLPSAYLQNMSDAISSTMKNTIGQTMNDYANRGVLNSSVTNKALNDIESNTANAVAQNYLNNISTVQGLTNDKFNNLGTSYNAQSDLANQQLNNTLSTNAANADVYNSLVNNATAGITTAAAAQEAAQAPALSLWNASLGLNGAGNSALAAAAGKGTTTSTATTSGGGLLSGLLGGL